jgi:hypothetical protein
MASLYDWQLATDGPAANCEAAADTTFAELWQLLSSDLLQENAIATEKNNIKKDFLNNGLVEIEWNIF